MKILITGSTGFVGSHLVNSLKNNHEIFALTNDRAYLEKSSGSVKYMFADLTQPIVLDEIKEIDCIIHLAQGNQKTIEGAPIEFKVNVVATMELLEFARTHGARKFILASSGTVYGFGPRKFKETDSYNPINMYGATKIAAEGLVKQYESYFDCVILRFFFPYGPGTPPVQLFGRLASNIQTGQEIQIKNNGEPKITPLFIDDLMTAFIKILDLNKSITLNLAGTETSSILDLSNRISKIIGKTPIFNKTYEKPTGQNMMAEIDLARKTIDFAPKTSLDEGLKQMIESIKN